MPKSKKSNGQPTPEQEQLLSRIVNLQECTALLQTIAAGEEIPEC